MKSLGLIEVIGFISAVEASDSCLKAANVSLSRIDRVGAGIVTVSIVGDVGAVKAAVDAAKIAVEKIGTLRSAHVIPRLNSDVEEFLYNQVEIRKNVNHEEKKSLDVKENDTAEDVITNYSSDLNIDDNQTKNDEVIINSNQEKDINKKTDIKETESKGEVINSNETIEKIDSKTLKIENVDLSKYSVKELKTKIKTHDASVNENALNKMKKEELIKYFDKLSRKDK